MNWFQKPAILTQEQMQKIHASSLDILKTKGVVYQSEAAREALKAHGATVEGEIVYLPESLVEECLAKVPSTFRVDSVNPDRAVTVGGDLVIHPAGGEVFLKDADNTRHNTTTIQQFSDLQKIYQACDNINMTGYQPLSPVTCELYISSTMRRARATSIRMHMSSLNSSNERP